MTFPAPAVSAQRRASVVVRRKQDAGPGLPLPAHLAEDAVWSDPERWKRERFEWARHYEWPPGKIGFLAFFLETVNLHRMAKVHPPAPSSTSP